MRMNKSLSYFLIAVGLLLLCIGIAYPSLKFATVITDDTPPFWTTVSGVPNLSPKNGGVYSEITAIIAGAGDRESGVVSVVATIGAVNYPLTFTLGDSFIDGIWAYYAEIPLAPGQYGIKYVATNRVGLVTTYTGTFVIVTPGSLTGNWYINDVLVSNPNQTLSFQTLTLTFKFVKTTGTADSQISCTVVEGGSTLLTLAYQGSGTWTGTKSFAGGKHILDLNASDGVNIITMATLSIDFGSVQLSDVQLVCFIVGGACIAVGGYGLTGKKKS